MAGRTRTSWKPECRGNGLVGSSRAGVGVLRVERGVARGGRVLPTGWVSTIMCCRGVYKGKKGRWQEGQGGESGTCQVMFQTLIRRV